MQMTTTTTSISGDGLGGRVDKVSDDPVQPTEITTLGHIRLRDEETNQIILIPSPSDDPKDPLRWYVCIC